MGDTYFLEVMDIKMKPIDKDILYPIVNHLRDFSKNAYYALDLTGYYNTQIVWKNLVEEMERFSLIYTDYIFIVREGNIWNHYFYRGKSALIKGEIVFKPFNMDMLE